jgi:RNA polymerase nonessential primary-like sigma factor
VPEAMAISDPSSLRIPKQIPRISHREKLLAKVSALPPQPLRRTSSTDVVRQYLRDIGRVAMLTEEEELTLARLVQHRQRILDQHPAIERPGADLVAVARANDLSEASLRQTLRQGRRAKERMIQANLRLVVAVAKKYQGQGLELLDLVQEGTLGLERGVERFDPTRGFRLSTFAYWWIRQGITRAIASQSRTIRLPVHITEKLNRLKKAQRELTARLGRSPRLPELARELGLSEEVVRLTLQRQPRSISLDVRVGRDQDVDLGDLLEDGHATPEQTLAREQLHDDLEALLEELTQREAAVIRQRFGLEDDTPRTLTEIGETLHLSRERVRQIEHRALLKLRQPRHRSRVRDYLGSLD